MLLMVLPAGTQQFAPPRVPNFYVPYGVRDVPVGAMELESSSGEMWTADPGPRPNAPMPRPYPMRRRSYRRFGPGYGPPPSPQVSTGAVIAGVAAVVVALVVLAAGDH
jgi:hypothetical protein